MIQEKTKKIIEFYVLIFLEVSLFGFTLIIGRILEFSDALYFITALILTITLLYIMRLGGLKV